MHLLGSRGTEQVTQEESHDSHRLVSEFATVPSGHVPTHCPSALFVADRTMNIPLEQDRHLFGLTGIEQSSQDESQGEHSLIGAPEFTTVPFGQDAWQEPALSVAEASTRYNDES